MTLAQLAGGAGGAGAAGAGAGGTPGAGGTVSTGVIVGAEGVAIGRVIMASACPVAMGAAAMVPGVLAIIGYAVIAVPQGAVGAATTQVAFLCPKWCIRVAPPQPFECPIRPVEDNAARSVIVFNMESPFVCRKRGCQAQSQPCPPSPWSVRSEGVCRVG